MANGGKIIAGVDNVPTVGMVSWTGKEHRNAGGQVYLRLLTDARYVDDRRPVVSPQLEIVKQHLDLQ